MKRFIVLFLCLAVLFLPLEARRRWIPQVVSSGGGTVATFIDTQTASNDASGSTLSTPSTNLPTGAAVFAWVRGTGASDHPPTSVTIGSQSMTLLYSTTDGGGTTYWLTLWVLYNATADPTAVGTANWNPVDSSTFRGIRIATYTGIVSSAANDQTPTNVNTGTTTNLASSSTSRTTQNLTTANSKDLLIGYYLNYNTAVTGTAAAGWTLRGAGGAQVDNFSEKAVSSTNTYPSGNFATVNTADQYMAIFSAFKVAP